MRRDLRGLSKEGADWVAAHLVAAGALADEEPELAWRHARAARARGGRIGVVRETVGLVAYRAGEWAEAIGELRAARRMGGGPGHLAVMADCERALGHPERAIELSRSTEADALDPEAAIELQIVVAGARADLEQVDAALAQIQRLGLDKVEGHARLAYAYANLLLKAGRRDEAVGWFIRSANADLEEETDALERLAELGADEDDERPAAGVEVDHDERPAAGVEADDEQRPAAGVEADDERGPATVAPTDDPALASAAGVDGSPRDADDHHGRASIADPDDDRAPAFPAAAHERSLSGSETADAGAGRTVVVDGVHDSTLVAEPADGRDHASTSEPFDGAPAEAPGFTDVQTSPAGSEGPPAGPEAEGPALTEPAPAGSADPDRPATGPADGAEPSSADPDRSATGPADGAEPSSANQMEQAPAVVPTVLFSDDPQTGDQ